ARDVGVTHAAGGQDFQGAQREHDEHDQRDHDKSHELSLSFHNSVLSFGGAQGLTRFSGFAMSYNDAKMGSAPGLSPGASGLLRADVELAAALAEFLGLLAQALSDGDGLSWHAVLGGVLPDLLRDLHRAELGTAHRAEVRDLGALGRQGLVVELAGRLRIEREVELVLPAKLEACLRERIVPRARARMALREVGGVRGDLV